MNTVATWVGSGAAKYNIHIAENCSKCNKLYSVYNPLTLCMKMKIFGQSAGALLHRWPPLMEMLVAEN